MGEGDTFSKMNLDTTACGYFPYLMDISIQFFNIQSDT